MHRVHVPPHEGPGQRAAGGAPGEKRLNPAATAGQDELFTSWRCHGFLTNSTQDTIQADDRAHLAARVGASPVIVDRGRVALKSFDPDLVELLVDRGRGVGIDLRRCTTIAGVEPGGRGYRVTLERDGAREAIETGLCARPRGTTPPLSW